MLGEIADHQTLAEIRDAFDQRQFAGDGLDQRRFAGAIDPQQADALAALQRKFDARDDRLHGLVVDGIAGDAIFQYQQRVGGRHRLAEFEGKRRRCVDRRQFFHLREHLHPALCLPGLARLGLEAIDERLQVVALALLLFLRGLVQGQRHRTRDLELRIVAAVAFQLLLVDVHDHADHPVEEIAIVRNDDQRAGVALEPVFQPQDGVEVQMVGRLVEQQQVGRAHQRLGQVQAHPPAAGKMRHGVVHLRLGKTQAGQQLLGARAHRIGARVGQRGVQFADAVAMRMIVMRGIFRLVGRKFSLERAQRGVAVDHIFKRRAVQCRGFLCHVRHAPLRRDFDAAAVGVQATLQQAEQRGLAGSVGADQPDMLAGIEGDIGGIEQRFDAPGETQGLQANHGGALSSGAFRGHSEASGALNFPAKLPFYRSGERKAWRT